MMNHIVKNRRHIWNPPGMGSPCMDFHIHNARNHFHRMSLKCHMDNAIRYIALVVVGTIPRVMVRRTAVKEQMCQHFALN